MPLKYPLELREKASVLLFDEKKSVQEVALLLGVSASVVYKWKNIFLYEAENNASPADKEELIKLRKKVRELRAEIEILKLAVDVIDKDNKIKFYFIKKESSRYPVRLLCRILKVSKSAFYDWSLLSDKDLTKDSCV